MANDNNIDLYQTPINDLPAPFGIETRGIKCPDGVTRLLTYPRHIWDWSDHFIEEDLFADSQINDIDYCWNFTLQRYPNKVNESFAKIFYYNIIGKYKVYNGLL